jgi:hypothetical protein
MTNHLINNITEDAENERNVLDEPFTDGTKFIDDTILENNVTISFRAYKRKKTCKVNVITEGQFNITNAHVVKDSSNKLLQHYTEMIGNFNELLILDKEQVPYINLREEFGHTITPNTKSQIIVVNNGDRQVDFSVDQITGEYQAVAKPIGSFYKNQDFISGGFHFRRWNHIIANGYQQCN